MGHQILCMHLNTRKDSDEERLVRGNICLVRMFAAGKPPSHNGRHETLLGELDDVPFPLLRSIVASDFRSYSILLYNLEPQGH